MREQKLALVQSLLTKYSANPSAVCGEGNSVLMWAAWDKSVSIVRALLAAGAEVSFQNAKRQVCFRLITPHLSYACHHRSCLCCVVSCVSDGAALGCVIGFDIDIEGAGGERRRPQRHGRERVQRCALRGAIRSARSVRCVHQPLSSASLVCLRLQRKGLSLMYVCVNLLYAYVCGAQIICR